MDKTILILYSFCRYDLSLAFYFETWLSFFCFYEPSSAHLFFQYLRTFMCPYFFSFSSWTFMCPKFFFSILLHSTCLLNHKLRERSLYCRTWSIYSNTCFLSTPSVGVEYFFCGRRHVLAYS